MVSRTMTAPRHSRLKSASVRNGRNGKRHASTDGTEVPLFIPAWALARMVQYFRFLKQERETGPALTRYLLDGK
jgi:hypothetical protein